MQFMDLNDDVLLYVLFLINPEDLLGTYGVCERLRELSLCVINKLGPKLNITGTGCFRESNFDQFESNLDRIRVHKNWKRGDFGEHKLFENKLAHIAKLVINDRHLLVSNKGEIRRPKRSLGKSVILPEFDLFCAIEGPIVSTFAVKEDVLFAGTYDGTCSMIVGDQQEISDLKIHESYKEILALDFHLNHSVFVTSNYQEIKVWNRDSGPNQMQLSDEIPRRGRCLKLDRSGRRFIVGDIMTNYQPRTSLKPLALYDMDAVSGTQLNCDSSGVLDVDWKDDNTILATHWDGSLRVFDLRTNSDVQRIDKDGESDKNVSIQFDGSAGVLCGYHKSESVHYIDLRTNKVVSMYGPFKHQELSTHLMEIVADSKQLYVVNNYEVSVCNFNK